MHRVVSLGLLSLGLCLGCGASDDTATGDAADGGGDEAGVLESAPEPSCERFELLGDLARDRQSGLTWTRFVELDFATHEEASQRCQTRGMRLPVRRELETLIDPEADDCKLPCGFYGHRCATLICDTAISGSRDHWGVSFSAAALVLVPESQGEGFVCVR